jgi:hypothetical protein
MYRFSSSGLHIVRVTTGYGNIKEFTLSVKAVAETKRSATTYLLFVSGNLYQATILFSSVMSTVKV